MSLNTENNNNTTFAERCEALKAQYIAEGKTLADWARANGYSKGQVYIVTGGFSKCLRGKSHEIAVKLGLK